MLRLRLDLLPHGSAADAQLIGQLTVVNDLTGTLDVANYTVELRTTGAHGQDTEARRDRVEGFARSRGAWALVAAALTALGVEP